MGAAGIVTGGGNWAVLLAGPIGRSGNISISSQSLSSCFAGTGRNVRTSPTNDFATTRGSAWATATASILPLSAFRDCALADEKKPKLTSARNTPARKTNRPTKTRRLMNPPLPRLRQIGFVEYLFFIVGIWVGPAHFAQVEMELASSGSCRMHD